MDLENAETKIFKKFPEVEQDYSNFEGIDICFCVDVTFSMDIFLSSIKELIHQLIDEGKEKIKELQTEEKGVRFAIVGYRDHLPYPTNDNLIELLDFTDHKEAAKFVGNIEAIGGGDLPEAVLDGLNACSEKLSWGEKTEKILYLIADAPPHGKQFTDKGDNYPEGTPSGLTEDKVLASLREKNIDFSIIQLTADCDKMVEVFSEHINFELVDLKNVMKDDQFNPDILPEEFLDVPMQGTSLFGMANGSNSNSTQMFSNVPSNNMFNAPTTNVNTNYAFNSNFSRPKSQTSVMNMNINKSIQTRFNNYSSKK